MVKFCLVVPSVLMASAMFFLSLQDFGDRRATFSGSGTIEGLCMLQRLSAVLDGYVW